MIFAILTVVVQLVLLLQARKNTRLFPRLQRSTNIDKHLDLTVCLPMRNEERNASRLLDSLLKEEPLIREIIILDDQSTDSTPEILFNYERDYPNTIRIIQGKPKPDDWRGKVWAMSQLANEVKSEYLLFIDSDVYLEEGAIGSVVNEVIKNETDFFSVFPTQITKPSTDILINHIFTTLLHLLPMQFISDSKYPSAIAGCGQVQLIKKATLDELGGYEILKNSLHDGLHLARKVKSIGGKVSFAYGNNIIKCKMYDSFTEAWSGFSRNAFQAGGIISIIFTSTILLFAYILGPIFSYGNIPQTVVICMTTILLYANYFTLIRSFDMSPLFILRLPISILLSSVLQFWSYLKNIFGITSIWKDRQV